MMNEPKKQDDASNAKQEPVEDKQAEVGGFESREEPTRYGDWDVNGRCSDF